MGFRACGLGFRALGLGFRAWGVGFRAWGLGFAKSSLVQLALQHILGMGLTRTGLGFLDLGF